MLPLETAKPFVRAINTGDIDRLAGLMIENHTFVDSDGRRMTGRERMRSGGSDYFMMVPDYKIEITDRLERDRTVVMLGYAEGTFPERGKLWRRNHWKAPAAWRSVVEGGKVALWQVYVNPEPMNTILQRIQEPGTPIIQKRKTSS